jgi:hypothetical protein
LVQNIQCKIFCSSSDQHGGDRGSKSTQQETVSPKSPNQRKSLGNMLSRRRQLLKDFPALSKVETKESLSLLSRPTYSTTTTISFDTTTMFGDETTAFETYYIDDDDDDADDSLLLTEDDSNSTVPSICFTPTARINNTSHTNKIFFTKDLDDEYSYDDDDDDDNDITTSDDDTTTIFGFNKFEDDVTEDEEDEEFVFFTDESGSCSTNDHNEEDSSFISLTVPYELYRPAQSMYTRNLFKTKRKT